MESALIVPPPPTLETKQMKKIITSYEDTKTLVSNTDLTDLNSMSIESNNSILELKETMIRLEDETFRNQYKIEYQYTNILNEHKKLSERLSQILSKQDEESKQMGMKLQDVASGINAVGNKVDVVGVNVEVVKKKASQIFDDVKEGFFNLREDLRKFNRERTSFDRCFSGKEENKDKTIIKSVFECIYWFLTIIIAIFQRIIQFYINIIRPALKELLGLIQVPFINPDVLTNAILLFFELAICSSILNYFGKMFNYELIGDDLCLFIVQTFFSLLKIVFAMIKYVLYDNPLTRSMSKFLVDKGFIIYWNNLMDFFTNVERIWYTLLNLKDTAYNAASAAKEYAKEAASKAASFTFNNLKYIGSSLGSSLSSFINGQNMIGHQEGGGFDNQIQNNEILLIINNMFENINITLKKYNVESIIDNFKNNINSFMGYMYNILNGKIDPTLQKYFDSKEAIDSFVIVNSHFLFLNNIITDDTIKKGKNNILIEEINGGKNKKQRFKTKKFKTKKIKTKKLKTKKSINKKLKTKKLKTKKLNS
jgi:hypothetical protein